LFQAANAGEFSPAGSEVKRKVVLFGWRPHDIGWLSCTLQFPGTLLFNINTFDALLPKLDWLQQDLAIWAPDVAGSVLFLASGYLAFIETCHTHITWRPQSISWWVTFSNLLGCVAFMISAVFAFIPARPLGFDAAGLALLFTLIGAAGFFVGSLLMLPETAMPAVTDPLH
jgi:predicted membrane protein